MFDDIPSVNNLNTHILFCVLTIREKVIYAIILSVKFDLHDTDHESSTITFQSLKGAYINLKLHEAIDESIYTNTKSTESNVTS